MGFECDLDFEFRSKSEFEFEVEFEFESEACALEGKSLPSDQEFIPTGVVFDLETVASWSPGTHSGDRPEAPGKDPEKDHL